MIGVHKNNRAVARAERIALLEDIFVVTEHSHIKHVYDQLPMLPVANIVSEPARKGTASCIIAALAIIKKKSYDNSPIIFMHADHYIEDVDSFAENLKECAVTTNISSTKATRSARATVLCNKLFLPVTASKCLGKSGLDIGQRRLPEPPAIITIFI